MDFVGSYTLHYTEQWLVDERLNKGRKSMTLKIIKKHHIPIYFKDI